MAENNNERRTFKWGDQEYLLDDLLKEHVAREQEFYRFAKDKGSYDATALAGLRNAITNRINAAKSGKAFQGDGSLDDDVVDNISIQTQKKGLFKKEKYVDQDNTVWAKHYMNKLMSLLKPYDGGKNAGKGDWDMTKHGFEAYLNGQGLSAKDIFEKYDLKDESNSENRRSFAGRHDLLRKQLENYRTWLQGKGFDFTKNDNEWDDDFMTSLDTLINNQDWSDSAALSANLRKLGAGDYYTTAFTSDRWDLSKTNEQTSEEAKKAAEEKKAKEEREAYAKHMKGTYDVYSALGDNNLGGTYFTSDGDGVFEMSDSEYEKWLNKHTDDADAYMKKLQESYYKNPFDAKIAGEYLPLAGRFGALKEVNIDGKVWSYDPRTIDRKNNRVVVFDKETGEMKHTFLGDVEEELKRMKREWRLQNGYEEASEKYTKYDEQGGILTMQTGGGFNLAQAVNRDLAERNKARAKETGNSEEVQKARDRVVSNGDDSFVSEKNSIAQPDAGFSGSDIARLISIGADITSMFLDPVTGTAVGLGSTLTNFGADIADDGFQWDDVKNLGINVGFDLLGAIPLFGDALGTGTKITRQLLKWAPRVMAGLAAYQGVANFDGMMNSWGKFVSGDKDQKLTVQDWRNIAQSIGLITGGTRAIKNKAAQANMKKQAKVDGVVGVNVRDKNTGEIKQLLIDGDTAKVVRNHKGDKTKIENELAQLETLKGKFGENGDFEVVTKGGKWQRPVGRSENADGSKSWELRGLRGEGRADVRDVYDFSRVQQGPHSIGYQIPVVSQWLNNKHQMLMNRLNTGLNQQSHVGAKTSKQIDDEIAKLRQDQNGKAGVDTTIDNVKAAMDSRNKVIESLEAKVKTTIQQIKELQKKLKGTRKTDLQAELSGLHGSTKGLKTIEVELQRANDHLNNLKGKLDAVNTQIQTKGDGQPSSRLQQTKAQLESEIATGQVQITAMEAQLQSLKKAGQVRQTKEVELRGKLNDFNELGKLQRRLTNLQRNQDLSATTVHTGEYNKLRQMLADLQANHSNIGGRQVNWDIQEILKQAGIQNAFKEGGSINRTKINKFLNYGKG